VLEASGHRVREAFAGTEEACALRHCIEAGTIALLTKASFDVRGETLRLQELFTRFFGDLFTAGELSKLLRGRLPDMEELRYCFEQAGYDEGTLPGLDFGTEMATFKAAFVEAALAEPLLRDRVQPGILLAQKRSQQALWDEARALVKRIRSEQTDCIDIATGKITVGDVANGGRVIHQWGGMSSTEERIMSSQSAYLRWLFKTVSPICITNLDHESACSTDAPLDLHDIYTNLLTLTPVEPETMRDRHSLPDPEGEMLRLSALAQLDRYDHLVLLGDPGSGKSTFVNFVALCLAGEALRREDANLSRMTESLLVPERNDELVSQSWSHGVLLPLVVILRDFAAAGLPEPGEEGKAQHLCDFIETEMISEGLSDYVGPLWRYLEEEGGLLLLDGLDEVPATGSQRSQIKQVVEDFVVSFPLCRILVTSRPYAYQEWNWRFDGFKEAVLAPFDSSQIRHFVDRWYAHMGQVLCLRREHVKQRARLLKRAIFASDRLYDLARRPLLLSLMACLHAWRNNYVPDKIEKLYAEAVDLLLECWESQRVVRRAGGRVELVFPGLAEWLNVGDRAKVRALLNQLAYETHAEQSVFVDAPDISGEKLVNRLMAISQNPDVDPTRLAEYLSRRAGLLIPRGVDLYAFPHRILQEYLAACHLTDYEYPHRVADLARKDPHHWREVVLLAGAKSAGGSDFALWALIDALCRQGPVKDAPQHEADGWGDLLAGQVLVENADLTHLSDRKYRVVVRVRNRLARVLEGGNLPAVERVGAGRILAQLGDPRRGVGVREDGLPDITWREVPAGSFLMGSADEDERAYGDEKPQHTYHLERSYAISRYLVTNAQFAAFAEAGGYDCERYWPKVGWIWCKNEQIAAPLALKEPWSLPNHPCVGVNWYEAVAFCRWLTEALRECGDLSQDQEISLPSEPQWEKASRGEDGRAYAWGTDPDPSRANYDDLGIGTTSAVGCFLGGGSPYGLEDVSGNVWEWTRSLWGKDWSDPKFKYPYNAEDGRENLDAGDEISRILRGGAFYNCHRFLRCAYRLRDIPLIRVRSYGFRVVLFPIR
jgi:formylglycine-generating enzyme required for sulfatase activity